MHPFLPRACFAAGYFFLFDEVLYLTPYDLLSIFFGFIRVSGHLPTVPLELFALVLFSASCLRVLLPRLCRDAMIFLLAF